MATLPKTSMESPSRMEPLMPSEGLHTLENKVAELLKKSSALGALVRVEVSDALGELVRSMNCYYSNLIEGHNTHPRDIDQALRNDYSSDAKKRALQHEAKAHIHVQHMIDNGTISGNPVAVTTLCFIHKEFCSRLPEEFLWVENPDTHEKIKLIPGALRSGEVAVGLHSPPQADSLPDYLNRFENAYNPEKLSQFRQVIAIAASHHRLLWIHPFYDGNGRVARLLSHAYLRHVGIGSSLWSVSRGLARHATEYKELLMQADMPRQGDLDGRGNLTHKGLVAFCEFFLDTCIDQVNYMASILEPKTLLDRIERYTQAEILNGTLPKGSFSLLRESLLMGHVERGRAEIITGYKERQARTIVSTLLEKGLLISNTPKGALRINFPIDVIEYWFPKLYPEL